MAVLRDGAGISYGFCQFTHRSGALVEVLAVYLRSGGAVAKEIIASRIKQAKNSSRASVATLAADEAFKKALRAAAATREMKAAQIAVALRRYVEPAASRMRADDIRTAAIAGGRLRFDGARVMDRPAEPDDGGPGAEVSGKATRRRRKSCGSRNTCGGAMRGSARVRS